jgi:hypothetical protein
MPAAPAEPVVLPRAFLLHADHGCSPHPAFPAPSLNFEGGSMEKLGREPRRENDAMCLLVIASASEAIQNASAERVWIASLRSQ